MQMTSLDFLYLALAASAISITVFINIVLYQIILTLKMARGTLENVHNYTREAVIAKDKLKLGILRGAQKFLSFLPKKRR